MKCFRCDYEWIAKVEHPKMCPNCQSRKWYINGFVSTRTQYTPNDFIVEGEVCKIGLYNRKYESVGFAVIDLEFMEKCQKYKWCNDAGYCFNNKVGHLHHFILGIKPSRKVMVDHINLNPLDNRICNLRLCSNNQNCTNTNMRKHNTSGYKGVSYHKQINKYVARITKDSIVYPLGVYSTAEQAAMAYNKAAKELHGEFAVLNKILLIRRVKC